MEENSGSSSNYRNKSYDRHSYDRQSYDRQSYDRQSPRNYVASLDENDLKLFILLASIKRFEDYTYLFIVVWDTIKHQDDEELNDEIGQMNDYIEGLFTNSVINEQEMKKYSSLLNNFRDYRHDDFEAKKNLVSRALNKLERQYQLSRLRILQKKWLYLIRQMILDRMESFVEITRQTHIVDVEENNLLESLRKQNNALLKEKKIDLKFFIWFASIKRFEDYTYLFIVVWDTIKVQDDEEFNDEIGQMNNYIEDLFTNSVINKKEMEKYSSLLDNFRDYRYNDLEAKKNLVSHALNKLEGYGLNRLRHFGKKWLQRIRQMILDRMESFVEISRQTHIVDEEGNGLSLDDPIELRKEIESLRKQNTALVKENSHYQASLGNMTSARLSDQDPNNATKLNSDITELQHLLSEFTMVQGPEYKINEKKSTDLFSQYNCQINFSNPKAKSILGGILQRCVIEQILKDVNSYFKNHSNADEIQNPDDTIEVDILNITDRLIQSVNNFIAKRPGKDDITPTTPTKLRQQIYAALGYRGFSDDNHPFIVTTAKRICDAMDRFREIIDPDILNEIDAQSIQITHEVINIFHFRLKTQQIIPAYHFFQSGDEIDAHLMQGSWGREDVKKLEVEICYFPCIGIIDKENLSNQKIFTKAQVYTRPKKRNNTDDGGGKSIISASINRVKKLVTSDKSG